MRQTDILSQISKAINGEYSAIACYQKLKNLAPTKKENTVINEIRNDEIRHFNTFSNLYTQLTGKKHIPIISENCPDDYRKGIDFAFNDEQETVDMYLDIAYQTDNVKIKEEFLRAAHDEQNHAVWFLYFMK
ncbi:ferritin-like domain-containing protein [Niallia sp. JL1B1071]|uniref:ferritin-like domain-containing protein n=1 Tax=Niallia tiangongensis TaxID=3237105 RepID=UPI0037DDB583